MYCSRCGQAIGPQPVCANCGASTGIGGGLSLPISRVGKHLQTLGILWIVFAAYSVLRWVLLVPFLHHLFGNRMWMPGMTMGYGPFHPGGWLLELITVMVLARAILSLAADADQAFPGDGTCHLQSVGFAGTRCRPRLRAYGRKHGELQPRRPRFAQLLIRP